MKKPNAYTLDHQRDVWREAYNAALSSCHQSAAAFHIANLALADYIERWPLD